MNYLNRLLTLVLITGLAAVSCDGLLDVEPQQSISSDIALNTSDNVETVLTGAYDAMSDDDMFGGEYQMEADLLANSNTDPEVQWTGTFEEPEQIWQKDILTENGQVAATWSASYTAINIANNVLANLEVVDEDIRSRVEGEAKFIRGVTYFNLLKLYAQPWSAGNTTTNLGVPIVLEPTTSIDESANVARNTVAEGYAQVISDLTDAVSLLPATNGEFATSHAANAFLSRVYLQQGNYAAARDAAHSVISSGAFALTSTYASAFNNEGNSSEDVFAIQVSAQDGAHSLNLFYANSDFGGRGDIDITPTHIALYEAGDERLDLFYAGNTRTGKYLSSDTNIGVIRLAELHLTRAEGNLEEGTTVGETPLDDVNIVRNRVGLADLGAVDVPTILAERKLELMFEGQLLHDLKRRQLSIGNIPYNANNIVYPIPQREMDVNPNLVQNAGYTGN